MSRSAAVRRAVALGALAATAIVAWWSAVAATPAAAHAAIVETRPANGAVLETAPEEIALSFTEPPDVSLTTIEVVDRDGARVPTGPPERGATAREVHVQIDGLGDGVYTVAWRTVSTVDNHVTASSFSFGVGVAPGAVASVDPGSESTSPTVAGVAARWALYVSLAVLFGAATAGLLALGTDAVARPWLLGVSWAAAVAGVVAMTLDERASVGVPLGTLLSSDAGANLVRLAVALVLVGGAVLAVTLRPSAATLVALAATTGAAIVARATGGHAGGSTFDVAVQALHVAAVGTWIGGLVWLVSGLRSGSEPGRVRRFSNLATVALVAVVATGVLRASGELGGPGWFLDPFANGYRTALVAKLAFVVPLVGLGALNRFRNAPRIARIGPGALRRTVGGELVVAAAVFGMTGILTGLPPTDARDHEAAAARPLTVTGSDFATTTMVRLRVTPGTVGPNAFVAEVLDYDTREPVDAHRVSLEFALPDRPEVGSVLELGHAEHGTWRADGTVLAIGGTWDVTVLVERADGSVEVPLTLRPRTPDHRVEVSRMPGQPTITTIHLADGIRIQAYVDPGEPGRTNQLHVTAFAADGSELPLEETLVRIDPPHDEPFEPELLELGPGHVAANLMLEPGTWFVDVTAHAEDGRMLTASFDQRFDAGASGEHG